VDVAKPAGLWSIDSKAMRKVNPDQDIMFVGELSTLSNGYIMVDGGRMLVKLH